MIGKFKEHTVFLFDFFENFIGRMHDLHGSIKVWIMNIFCLNQKLKKRIGFARKKVLLLIRLHGILPHRYHHQYFRIIAIPDQVMVNHPVEKNLSFEDSVLMVRFVVVERVDAIEFEVGSAGLILH